MQEKILDILDLIKCKRCNAEDMLLTEQVKAQIPKYLEEIDEKMRVTDKEYQARLELCFECEGLVSGVMCKYCGCFVQMRALIKNTNCPSPLCKRW